MGTTLQQKKPLSRLTKLSESNYSVLKKLETNDWNPFVRVNPKLLEQLNRRLKKPNPQNHEDALL